MSELTGRMKDAVSAIDWAMDAMEEKFCRRDDINALGYVKQYLVEKDEELIRLRADLAAANTQNTELAAALELGQQNSNDAYNDLQADLVTAATQANKLAGVVELAVVMREMMRGKYGVTMEGPARHIAKLLGSIGAFDEAIEAMDTIPITPLRQIGEERLKP